MRNEKDSCYLRLWYFITKYIKAEITINPIIPMTGPYIASLLSIPVLDEIVVEKGVAVSWKNTHTHISIYIDPIYNIQIWNHSKNTANKVIQRTCSENV